MDTDDHKSDFSEWIRSPQTMIALSAVLLSVCGLFISIYETSLIREQQRASVWPNVEVTPSINTDTLKIFVENSGIGPARIMKASLTYKDEIQNNWVELISNFNFDEDQASDYQSLINGSVMPPNTGKELIYRVTSQAEDQRSNLAFQLSRAVLRENLDVSLCYCSVYDECWTTRLVYVNMKSRGEPVPSREERRVSSCSAAPESGI